MRKFFQVRIVVFVLIIIVAMALSWTITFYSDRKTIENIGQEHGRSLISYELNYFFNGPFWYRRKHDRIYRAEYRDSAGHESVAWIRTSIFGPSVIWEKE